MDLLESVWKELKFSTGGNVGLGDVWTGPLGDLVGETSDVRVPDDRKDPVLRHGANRTRNRR